MNRIIPLIILLVVGCATPREITHITRYVLDTNPQGATIICNGQDLGYAPTSVAYDKNIDIIDENRVFTEKEIARFIEAKKIKRGELKIGENIALTDEETLNGMWWTEIEKLIDGELKVGENIVLTNEEIKALTESMQIIDGKSTVSIDTEIMRWAIQVVKNTRESLAERYTCTAYWSSGVIKAYPLRIPYVYAGNGMFIYTIQRPEGAGYSQDAEFALKVKQLKQNQQTANQNASIAISAVQAQQRAAQAQERAASAQERAATSQAYKNNKSTTCYTNFGITTCY